MTIAIEPRARERLQVGSMELDVLRRGTGHPLVLLHGPHSVNPEAPFLDLLARQCETIAPSHPGFGQSLRADEFDTVYDLVHLYQDALDALPYDKVTLMGLSFGGWIAAEVAVNCSHKLDKLILVDPLGIKVSGREESDIVHVFNTHPAEVRRRAWHDPTTSHAGQFGFGWQTELDELTDAQIVTIARDWDALCLYGWRPYMHNPNLRKWLHRIQAPTLIVWGASDQLVSPAYKAAYGQLIPDARVAVIEAAGHHPEIEQPQAFVDRVVEFVGVEAADGG